MNDFDDLLADAEADAAGELPPTEALPVERRRARNRVEMNSAGAFIHGLEEMVRCVDAEEGSIVGIVDNVPLQLGPLQAFA